MHVQPPQDPAHGYPAQACLDGVLHVALLTDQNYVGLTATAIASLVECFVRAFREKGAGASCLSIHVICLEVDAPGKATMARAALLPEGVVGQAVRVEFSCVDHVLPGNPQGRQRWLQLVSLKLHLPSLLPALERVIFLDSDIVVVDDLRPLWCTDLEGHWLGVVPCLLDHPRCLANYDIFKIRFRHVAEPVNAGVLLLDLARMRAQGVTEQLVRWQQEHAAQLKLPEQEAISANFPRQWKVLDHRWNFRPYGEPYWTASSWPEFRSYLAIRPAIVHFQANVRPFDLRIDLPYFDHWQRNHRRVHGDQALRRKRLGYFQFVFFEYPEMMCRISNWLPGGLIRFGVMIPLLGLVTLPHAGWAYLRYLRHPEGYVLRIRRYLAAVAEEGT